MADDELELREALVHSLEQNGSLARLKAQLRAAIFLALEEKQPKHSPFVSQKAQSFLDSEDGKLATSLIRDFLEALDLSATISVFDKEIDMVTSEVPRIEISRIKFQYAFIQILQLNIQDLIRGLSCESQSSLLSRSKLAEQHDLSANDTRPLLAQLLKQRPSNNSSAPNFVSDSVVDHIVAISQPFYGHFQIQTEKMNGADKHIASKSIDLAVKEQSKENDDDFFLERTKTPHPVLSSSNSLEKSLELDDSPRKTALPAHPTLTPSSSGTQLKSLLGDLPPTIGLMKPKGSLPPLEALTSIKRPINDSMNTQNQRDFSKLFGDADANAPSSPLSTSESQSSSSSSSSSSGSTGTKTSKKSPKRGSISFTDQAEQKLNTDQTALFTNSIKSPANEAVFKKPSPRDMRDIDSMSEEIAEDLDVDDLLNSARSNADSISF